VITLPLAVLQARASEAGAVHFDPPLTRKQEALQLLAMGNVVKVMLAFRTAFWNEESPLKKALFVQDTRQPLPTWWNARPSDAPMWTGWAGGPMAEPVLPLQGDALLDVALASLSGAIGFSKERLAAELASWHSHDWSRDPFSRGAYSYVQPGGFHAPEALAAPMDRTLYFAGEATYGEGYNATMEGALLSGRRAAEQVIAEQGREP
jgi:monoamine oxidase